MTALITPVSVHRVVVVAHLVEGQVAVACARADTWGEGVSFGADPPRFDSAVRRTPVAVHGVSVVALDLPHVSAVSANLGADVRRGGVSTSADPTDFYGTVVVASVPVYKVSIVAFVREGVKVSTVSADFRAFIIIVSRSSLAFPSNLDCTVRSASISTDSVVIVTFISISVEISTISANFCANVPSSGRPPTANKPNF